ncbi:unnamed protein product [Rotaria sp. Silwood1]|nr:unnamed protein product [Rotaria sp. Silwood1]CAF3350374.1 unnamed protein product [Rotaria sp. Silwood1]CAF3420548.1 unnamed protein product [Rotaria sp. Silwood1]CAF4528680.1 unnamed protein product [Rotaria sp. Silwood1]CAF4636792.1 unnamed protein product [Rotaria sp. Silwood1]
MTSISIVSLNKEALIQRWQRQLIGRTHINFQELMHHLRQHFRREFTLLFIGETNLMSVMEFTDILHSVANLKSDTKWLSWLAYQFHMAVSKRRSTTHNGTQLEDSMDLETFKNSFQFKVPELADCLFNYLDTDKTGQLTLDKFIRNLEFLTEANDNEKVEFLFKIFDRDGDGTIDFDEMKLLFRCFLEQSPSLDMEETLAELTATLFQETDVDHSGDISFDELSNALRQNEHLFKVLSLSTSSWIRPKSVSISKYHRHSSTVRAWIRNNIDLIFFWSLYSFLCTCICINVLHFYIGQQHAHFLIIIARLNGGMLNFNCALMLVLMLRKHITWIRTKGGSVLLPLDHHIDIHKTIGIIILIETILHTAAHLAYLAHVFYICSLPQDIGLFCHSYTNVTQSLNNHMTLIKRYRFDSTINQCIPFAYLGCSGNWNNFYTEDLCKLRCKPYLITNHRYVNAIFTAKLGLGYITGVLEFLLGALIYTMCLPFVRKRGHFQLFYWCHMLTLPWLIIMLLHGPRFWKWLLIPGILYIIEKILRYRKSRSNKHGESFIMEAILLPSQVIHLVINKPRKFTYKSGDYIYINIPSIANFEWHPFSISSAPEHKESLWLHVHVNGHWTRRVYELFRRKLIEKHGGMLNDFNDLRLRSSMRSRMSKSYIDELRGIHQQEINSSIDLNNNNDKNKNNDNSNHSSNCSTIETHSIQPKSISISFPTGKNQKKIICSSCQSTFGLHDIQLNSIDKNHSIITEVNSSNIHTVDKSILMNPHELENMTVEDIEKLAYEKDDIKSTEQQIKTITILKPAIKNNNNNNNSNHRLTAPANGDYCIRIANTSTICREQQQIELHETRLSDALGYLRMYKSHNRIQFNSLQFNDREDLQVLIDGPYGAPSQHIFEAEHAVLIAAGIGITPFASILQSIMCRYRNRRHKCPNCEYIWDNPESEELCLKKVDFIWVTREQRSLEWFISLLAQMEIEQQRLRQNSDKGSLLEVHLYVTSAQSQADLKALNIYLSLDLIGRENSANCDAIDGIRQRTKHGRPDWDQVFTELLCQKKGKISVFYCGPPSLSAELTTKCRQYGFAYKKELF